MNQGIKMLYENTVAFIDTVEALGLDDTSGDGVHELLCLVEACKLQLKDGIFDGYV